MNYPIISLNKIEGSASHELNIALPATFDLSVEILGISITCPISAIHTSIHGMTNSLGIIETTEGFVGIQLTEEQKATLSSIFDDSEKIVLIKAVEYPTFIPSIDNPTLLSYKVVGYV